MGAFGWQEFAVTAIDGEFFMRLHDDAEVPATMHLGLFGAGSSPCRTTIPAHAGPPFQSMPGQRSGACRATILVMPAGV